MDRTSRLQHHEGLPRLGKAPVPQLPNGDRADFLKQSGVFYNPLGGKPPVIIRSPEAMQELSEAPQLSQRAVYSDVGSARSVST